MADTVTAAAAVEAARSDAVHAQEEFLRLERLALEGDAGERPSAADVLAQRHEASLSARRVEVAQRRLSEAQAAERLAGLEAIGAEVDALAAAMREPSAELAAAAAAVADGAAAVRRLAAEHDASWRDLRARAIALRPEPADMSTGPLPSSALVALVHGHAGARHVPSPAIRHGDTAVREIGADAEHAVALAVAGDAAGALAAWCPVTVRQPRRPVAVYRDTVGQFPPMAQYGHEPDRALRSMIEDGRAVRLTPAEQAAWEKEHVK